MDFDPWSIQNFNLSLHKLVADFIIEYDSHRYDDSSISCFTKAVDNEDFVEAVSVCQYKVHGVEVMGTEASGEL